MQDVKDNFKWDERFKPLEVILNIKNSETKFSNFGLISPYVNPGEVRLTLGEI